jgi:cell division transport system ATP-binding protein
MINLKNITKTYPGGTTALKNVTLRIEPGEFVSIVGQSGTGKTTLVKLITAEEHPTRGKVVIGGWDISDIHPHDIPLLRRQIGMVFQDFKLLPKKTVAENVAFALEVSGATGSDISRIVPQLLTIVGLGEKKNRFPRQLSGGEQQRVAIARALVHRPKILIADEPTGNLDAINAHDIIGLLEKINEFGTTVVLVTHNKDVVNTLRRRVVTLDAGHVVSDQEGGTYIL